MDRGTDWAEKMKGKRGVQGQALDTAEGRGCSARATAGGRAETQTGKSLVLQKLQVLAGA